MKTTRFTKLIAVLLVLTLVLGILPVSALAADPVSVTLKGHTAQLNSFKLYTYSGGQIGQTDLLEGVEDSDSSNTQVYTTSLEPGDYWVEGYDAAGDDNGGIAITVTAEGDNTFTLCRAYQIYATNKRGDSTRWVLDEDYTVAAQVTAADGTPRLSLIHI